MTPQYMEALRSVVAWARLNGWQRGSWDTARNEKWSVYFDTDGETRFCIEVRHRQQHYPGRVAAWFEPASPQQAVDVLCALRVLPPRFSTAYLAGMVDAENRRRNFEDRA